MDVEVVKDYISKKKAGILALVAVVAFAIAAGTWPGEDYIEADPALASQVDAGSTAWLIVASALVLLMTPGLAFFYGGMVQVKNVITTLMLSYTCIALLTLLWVFFTFSLAFGEDWGGKGILGYPGTYFLFKDVGGDPNDDFAPGVPFTIFTMFQLEFAVITPALISGSFCERVDFRAFCLFITLFAIFIYSPIAHVVWHPAGLLRVWGVLDFAGGTVVHMSSGYAALAGSLFIEPSVRHKTKEKHVPANVPFIMLGSALLLFGWVGFNGGSALAANAVAVQAFLNTQAAAASAMLTWLFMDYLFDHKLSASGACIGLVVGLVGITPACGFVNVGAAVMIGIITSIACFLMTIAMKKTDVDDTLDVFSCHGFGGTMGTLLTGLFASTKVNAGGEDGAFYGNPVLFGKHIAAVLIVAPIFFFGALLLFKITDMIVPLRVASEVEHKGLDSSVHGESMLDIVSHVGKGVKLPDPNMDVSGKSSVVDGFEGPLDTSVHGVELAEKGLKA